MLLSCLNLQWLPCTLRMKSKCLTVGHKTTFPILILVTFSFFSYMGLWTSYCIPWSVLDPIPAWATLNPSLRLSEGITFQEAFSHSPVPVQMWPTYILAFTPVMQCHVTCQSKELLTDTHTSFLLLNLQFSGLIKAMNGIYFSLLASVTFIIMGFCSYKIRLYQDPFQFPESRFYCSNAC